MQQHKTWVVISNRQCLDKVSLRNFVVVVRYLLCFGIYLVKKHVVYLSISGAFSLFASSPAPNLPLKIKEDVN